MAELNVASTQVRKIAEATSKNKDNPWLVEVLVKSLMGRGERGKGLSWSQGERFLTYIKSGILLDAFAVFNQFKR